MIAKKGKTSGSWLHSLQSDWTYQPGLVIYTLDRENAKRFFVKQTDVVVKKPDQSL